MLIRQHFITNSSTTSYLIYGVPLKQDKLITYLGQTTPYEKLEEALRKYGNDKLADNFKTDPSCEMWEECLNEISNWDVGDLFHALLPDSIGVEIDSEGYNNYLLIQSDFKTEIKDGNVIIPDIKAEDIETLSKIAAAAGLKETVPSLHHWAVSEY